MLFLSKKLQKVIEMNSNLTINNKTMQKSNFSLILRAINDFEEISRKELSKLTGLTPSSVTNIVNRLLEERYIIETGSGTSECGRKPIILQINEDKADIIGIELSADKMIGILTGFSGKVRSVHIVKNRNADSVDAAVEAAGSLVESLLAETNSSKDHLLGVGVMSAGPYDRTNGVMIDPPNFKGWHIVPIKSLLEKRLEVPVYFDRDSVGCVIAEYNSGQCREFRNIVAVLVNTIGIGGGAIVDGEVYYGLNNSAAEIGHMIVEIDGPLCGCGDRGCLEAAASGDAIVRDVKKRILEGGRCGIDVPQESVAIEDVVRAYREGDAICREIVRRSARYIGVAIGNIIKTVSPECIVIGGSLITLFPEYYDLINEYVWSRNYVELNGTTKIMKFCYGEIQSAVGAVKLVKRKLFESLSS
jgi:predicted NBD/HSP70 family sugar kinase